MRLIWQHSAVWFFAAFMFGWQGLIPVMGAILPMPLWLAITLTIVGGLGAFLYPIVQLFSRAAHLPDRVKK